jgi:hypothetical protein
LNCGDFNPVNAVSKTGQGGVVGDISRINLSIQQLLKTVLNRRQCQASVEDA